MSRASISEVSSYSDVNPDTLTASEISLIRASPGSEGDQIQPWLTSTSSLDMLAALASQVASAPRENVCDDYSEREYSVPQQLSQMSPREHSPKYCAPDGPYSSSLPAPWPASTAAGMAPVTEYKCGYCGRVKTSTSTGMDGRVRIRCECGGKHQDKKPRMHAMWHRCPTAEPIDEPSPKRMRLEISGGLSGDLPVSFMLSGLQHAQHHESAPSDHRTQRDEARQASGWPQSSAKRYQTLMNERAFLQLRKRASHMHTLEGRRRQRDVCGSY